MRDNEKNNLNEILNHIETNRYNKKVVYDVFIDGVEIQEPYLKISMADYRELCRMCGTPDMLTPDLKHDVKKQLTLF